MTRLTLPHIDAEYELTAVGSLLSVCETEQMMSTYGPRDGCTHTEGKGGGVFHQYRFF